MINLVFFRESLDEFDVTPVQVRQILSIVIAVSGPFRRGCLYLIPLLAGYFAGFAARADRSIGEECHLSLSRFWLMAFEEAVNRSESSFLLGRTGREGLADKIKNIAFF